MNQSCLGTEKLQRDLKVHSHIVFHLRRKCSGWPTLKLLITHVGRSKGALTNLILLPFQRLNHFWWMQQMEKNLTEISTVAIVQDFFREEIDFLDLGFSYWCSQMPYIKTAFPSITAVTSIRTIAETLNQSEVVKGMLGELDKVLKAHTYHSQ